MAYDKDKPAKPASSLSTERRTKIPANNITSPPTVSHEIEERNQVVQSRDDDSQNQKVGRDGGDQNKSGQTLDQTQENRFSEWYQLLVHSFNIFGKPVHDTTYWSLIEESKSCIQHSGQNPPEYSVSSSDTRQASVKNSETSNKRVEHTNETINQDIEQRIISSVSRSLSCVAMVHLNDQGIPDLKDIGQHLTIGVASRGDERCDSLVSSQSPFS